MTAINLNETATATHAAIIERIAPRRDRDAKLAENAIKRSESYLAFFATAYFANVVTECEVDLDALFGLCDKTLNRLDLMLKATRDGEFFLRNESDQNRYAFNLIKTMVNAHNAKVAMVTREDTSACGNKREGASDYVAVSSRIMSDATEKRQVGIALYVLEALNMIETQKKGRDIVGFKVKPKSAAFKRFAKMVKASQTAA